MNESSVIRKIYLYLFSLVGLALLIVGCVRFIDMGLKAWIFTEAEKQDVLNYERPMDMPKFVSETVDFNQSGKQTITLSESEVNQLEMMFNQYEAWQADAGEIDYLKARRQRDASINLALILVGLPLYLYHWLTIRKEVKKV